MLTPWSQWLCPTHGRVVAGLSAEGDVNLVGIGCGLLVCLQSRPPPQRRGALASVRLSACPWRCGTFWESRARWGPGVPVALGALARVTVGGGACPWSRDPRQGAAFCSRSEAWRLWNWGGDPGPEF